MIKDISCKVCSNAHCFVQRYCTPEWLERIDLNKEQVLYKQLPGKK